MAKIYNRNFACKLKKYHTHWKWVWYFFNINVSCFYLLKSIFVIDQTNLKIAQTVKDNTKKKNQKIFIVHRLDKDTSGIVLFAKNEKIKNYLQDNWSNVQRYYVALVEGKITAKGEIKSYLKETKTLLTYSAKEGKFAHTKYEPIMISNKCTLLNIQILTGRKNQIRVHMKDINHPIVGDQKYGSKIKSVKYLYLTANKVVFIHPITKKEINLEIDIPKEYINYLNKSNIIAK